MPDLTPQYPIYIPSKGRWETAMTPPALEKDGVPHWIVVEPQEEAAYVTAFGRDRVLTMPHDNLGMGAITARNWIMNHSIASGAERHWQLDDNMWRFSRRYKRHCIPCDSGLALRMCEVFTDRYANVGLSGLNYEMLLINGQKHPPFNVNTRIYSCTLVNNAIPFRWRVRYNDDTDLTLQVLAGGWCTILLNAFCVWKQWTGQMAGGMGQMYHGDGRLKMARSLERDWPGVVTVSRRFQRPQHVVKDSWKRFDTPLKLKEGIDLSALTTDEHGITLREVQPIRSAAFREMIASRIDIPAEDTSDA